MNLPTDPMSDLKVWLINNEDLGLDEEHVYFVLPKNEVLATLGAPVLRLYRSGGGASADTDTPELNLRVGIEVWGFGNGTDGQPSDWPKVRQMASLLESEFQKVLGPTVLNPAGTSTARSMLITAFPERPDPELGWPRMVADALVIVRQS